MAILYVCADCADNNEEACGYYDPQDLRVMPDGRWLCDGCFDCTTPTDRGESPDDDPRGFYDFPAAPEYIPKAEE